MSASVNDILELKELEFQEAIGQSGERHNGGTRPLPAEDKLKSDRSGRNNVGEREHAPEHRVAPLAFEQRMVALRLRLLNVSHALHDIDVGYGCTCPYCRIQPLSSQPPSPADRWITTVDSVEARPQ